MAHPSTKRKKSTAPIVLKSLRGLPDESSITPFLDSTTESSAAKNGSGVPFPEITGSGGLATKKINRPDCPGHASPFGTPVDKADAAELKRDEESHGEPFSEAPGCCPLPAESEYVGKWTRPECMKDSTRRISAVYNEWYGRGDFLNKPREGGVAAMLETDSSWFKSLPPKLKLKYWNCVYLTKTIHRIVSAGADVDATLQKFDQLQSHYSFSTTLPFLSLMVDAVQASGDGPLHPDVVLVVGGRSENTSYIGYEGDKSPRKRDLGLQVQDGSTGLPLLPRQKDPNQLFTYVEELAFLYHDPPALGTDEALVEESATTLTPLPRASPPPVLPSSSGVKWSWNEEQRIVKADFTGVAEQDVQLVDKLFYGKMMQRDDVTLVSKGLVENLDEKYWDLEFIKEAYGETRYHRFRIFKRMSDGSHVEAVERGFLSMRICDFVDYLDMRDEVLRQGSENKCFVFINGGGKQQMIDVVIDVLYMIDVDMIKLLPCLYADFRFAFKMKEILPGGDWCLTNAVGSFDLIGLWCLFGCLPPNKLSRICLGTREWKAVLGAQSVRDAGWRLHASSPRRTRDG
jgi:hypothetical protein